MIQFDYDRIMKRYDVKVPQTIAGETSQLTIAYISKDDKLMLFRELSISFVRQILMTWDEQKHMEEMRAKRKAEEKEREAGEFDKYFSNEEDDKPTFH